jgi:hypothetical protein
MSAWGKLAATIREDPETAVISCSIFDCNFDHALCDLGASGNIMPKGNTREAQLFGTFSYHQTEAVNYEIPPLPPGLTVTVHLDGELNKLKKIRNQKRCMRHWLATERRQQLGDSFNYSNNDLSNVIIIRHDARTVISNRRTEHEEVEVSSLTSNY